LANPEAFAVAAAPVAAAADAGAAPAAEEKEEEKEESDEDMVSPPKPYFIAYLALTFVVTTGLRSL
jgi:hypothetical protein